VPNLQRRTRTGLWLPLRPTKARYEAIIHVENSLSAGAVLRTQAIVTKLDVDSEKKWVSRVW